MPENRQETERPSLRERKKQQSRERIRQSALELFRSKGFAVTTVEEITVAAGVAKGTFFNYFPTKESILLDLSERELGRLQGLSVGLSAKRGQAGEGNPATSAAQRIRALLATLAEGLEADRDLVCQALCEAMRVPDLFSPNSGRLSLRRILTILIAQGQRAHEFRSSPPAETMTSALEALYFQQLYLWATEPQSTSLRDRLQDAFDLLLDGIRQRGL